MDSMDSFTHKSLITAPYRLTYSYYLSPKFSEAVKADTSRPVLLLLHGFPDDAHVIPFPLEKRHVADLTRCGQALCLTC